MSTRPPRRRVSRRRYQVRRLGVVAVVGLAVFGVVRLVGSLAGDGDGSVATADASSGPIDTSSDEAAGTGDNGVEQANGSDSGPDGPSEANPQVTGVTGTPPTSAEPSGPPTAADPARVLIVGDSDAGTFGPYLQQLLRETGIVETQLDYKVSSGLARPDFYDWHAALAEKVPASDPDIVVVTFGGNDAQFLADGSGGVVVGQPRPDSDNAEWIAEYRSRVAQVLDRLDGRTVVWVGIPNHISPDVSFRMQLQDQAVKAELAEHPEVRFVDTWTRFAGRNGGFAEFVIDPRDGQGKPVRAADGFHLNQTGAEILAIDISQVIFAELRSLGAAI